VPRYSRRSGPISRRSFRACGRADDAPGGDHADHSLVARHHLYKLTMMQAVLHQHPGAQVEYLFRCRSPDVDLVPFLGAISDQIDALCALRATPEELDYLRGLRFIKPDFVDFLGLFHFDRKYVQLRANPDENG